MRIPIEIFDDDHYPTTCCREWGNKEKTCQFLRTKKFGQIEYCQLFDKDLDRRDVVFGEKLGFLIPCKQCKDLRVIRDAIICPYCGTDYYLDPKVEDFGKTKRYVCDHCNKEFLYREKVVFETEKDE